MHKNWSTLTLRTSLTIRDFHILEEVLELSNLMLMSTKKLKLLEKLLQVLENKLQSTRSLDLALRSYTVVWNLKLRVTINRLNKVKKEVQLQLTFKRVLKMIQLAILTLSQGVIKLSNLSFLKTKDLQLKVNLLKIKWNLLSMELKLSMINKVFLIWLKKSYNQKFSTRLQRTEKIGKNLFFKNLLMKFKTRKIMIKKFMNRMLSNNKKLPILLAKKSPTIEGNSFWLQKLTKETLEETTKVLQWLARVKLLKTAALHKCFLNNKFRERIQLEVCLQLNS